MQGGLCGLILVRHLICTIFLSKKMDQPVKLLEYDDDVTVTSGPKRTKTPSMVAPWFRVDTPSKVDSVTPRNFATPRWFRASTSSKVDSSTHRANFVTPPWFRANTHARADYVTPSKPTVINVAPVIHPHGNDTVKGRQ